LVFDSFSIAIQKEVTKRRRLKLSIIGVITLKGYEYSATAIKTVAIFGYLITLFITIAYNRTA